MYLTELQNQLLPLTEPAKLQVALKSAAVLMPLVKQPNNEWQVILTRRAEHLKHHPGQISFPGGRYENSDPNLSYTALRETHEEIGIHPDKVKLIGRLPQQHTVSQYEITPYVGVIDADYRAIADPNEVEEIFTVPLSFLTNESNQQLVKKNANDKQYNYYVIRYKHYNIWGATAKILVNFARRTKSLTSLKSNS
ncbi:CoA pyrophosphatase [Aliikangiella sp. IMCC44359]|uniref:CoA pyrophosphatase n=1 Tax=Aliikangiella sp. IMCC44359 TaxID=3459125 RepID=UPI00403AB405